MDCVYFSVVKQTNSMFNYSVVSHNNKKYVYTNLTFTIKETTVTHKYTTHMYLQIKSNRTAHVDDKHMF